MNPVNVLFIWHFHQPYYRDNYTGEFLMPWTGLHATKDYYFMCAMIKKHPGIRATLNFSPSLLSQLEYYDKNYQDVLKNERFLSISNKKITELSIEDKLFIMDKFLPPCAMSNNFLEKSPRFKGLYERYKQASSKGDLGGEDATLIFSTQEYLDIIILFNLLWIDPVSIESDDFLKFLKSKGRNFSESERDVLIREKIPGIINKIIPLLNELTASGQVELSGSPFYHPIIPLLCDTNIALFHDKINLPARFNHPEDADRQIKSSINYFKEKLNYDLKGMWPSEGSIGEKAASLFIENKIKWIATDEDILANSIGVDLSDLANRGLLYKPYVIKREHGYLYIFFRDRGLSDMIGFKYFNFSPDEAAEDLINNIKNIYVSLQKYNTMGISAIPIILDGENAWGYFKNNGYEFFDAVYKRLEENSDAIKTLTVSEYLNKLENTLNIDYNQANNNGNYNYDFKDIQFKNIKMENYFCGNIYNISTVYPGSWINHDFKIWIGDEEDNKAWDLLLRTRDYLSGIAGNEEPEKTDPALKSAWEQIYIAEGSDYNWWYGEDRTSGMDEEFDNLYRTHLINVFNFLNKPVPDDYNVPIMKGERTARMALDMVSFINPVMDGFVKNYFEWMGSAVYFPKTAAGKTMAHTRRLIKSFYFGFNESTLFIRYDILKTGFIDIESKMLRIDFINPAGYALEINFDGKDDDGFIKISGSLTTPHKGAVDIKVNTDNNPINLISIFFKNVLEISIPLNLLNINPLTTIDFYSILTLKDNPLVEIERLPVIGYFESVVPDKKFEFHNWMV